MLKKAVFEGPSANLRPFKNSNVAKGSIVKWSHVFISTARRTISGLTFYFKHALKMQIIGNLVSF